jgi:hypothetical protein
MIRILESLIQSRSICKILNTAEEIDSHNKYYKSIDKNTPGYNNSVSIAGQLKGQTKKYDRLFNRWLN